MKISDSKKIVLPVIWVLTTVSLGVWWLFLGLRQNRMATELASRLGSKIESDFLDKLERQSSMIKMEGTFFLFLLVTGGGTLIWLTFREEKRNKLIHDFFSTVTHEMKTPLASLRLQAESLLEEGVDAGKDKLLHRLLKDSDRIESQMNKALYLASLMRSEGLYLEELDLRHWEESLREEWSELDIQTEWKETKVLADRRALESIFRNLLENSVQHGRATKVKILSEPISGDKIKFKFEDNGKGFSGDFKLLGRLFLRHTSTSGTGVGLYIAEKLAKRMDGSFSVRNSESGGFLAELVLPSYSSQRRSGA
ncbi:sensor histidine kinase [Leptospira sp. WS58.C1]|uniref:sensor histidine kinase n=1 Tax=Leptospira TaxID=171 RepID=UPI0002BDDFCB|nr:MULTISPECIES: HAMP domain-containing sensor histidine kinase [unclassified Leptospira]EMJ99407.1 GHKL domain protein [Leptospira sp. B5-022]MCR1792453.1 HAMP domain-containing histidine kinase [Leptospira sp. id769339]